MGKTSGEKPMPMATIIANTQFTDGMAGFGIHGWQKVTPQLNLASNLHRKKLTPTKEPVENLGRS